MDFLLRFFFKWQPEYAAIAYRYPAKLIAHTRGNFYSVQNIPFNEIKETKPDVFYHNHPFGIGVFISPDDWRVYEGLQLALGYPFWAVITDFSQVKTWQISVPKDSLVINLVDQRPYKKYFQWGSIWFNLEKYLKDIQ